MEILVNTVCLAAEIISYEMKSTLFHTFKSKMYLFQHIYIAKTIGTARRDLQAYLHQRREGNSCSLNVLVKRL